MLPLLLRWLLMRIYKKPLLLLVRDIASMPYGY
jgi:hypothetical protein